MKIINSLGFVILLTLLITIPQITLAEYKNLKQTLAIIDFENKTTDTTIGSGVQDILTTTLWKSDRFVLVEREKIREILDEQDFSVSDRVSAIDAIKIGKILGADYILTGGITEAGLKKENNKTVSNIALDARLVDIASTQIILAETAFGKAPGTDMNSAIRNAVENLTLKIVDTVDKNPWQSQIIKLQDKNTIYINAGSEHGIKKGEEFTVYKQGEELIDPKTKTVVGHLSKKIGRIAIIDLQPKFSIATQIEGGNFEKGDIIKEE